MRNWKILLVLATTLVFFCGTVYALDNCYQPLKDAKVVMACGPAASGVTPFGTMRVVTQNDECYEYLTDHGQFIKYKKCEDDQWIEIEHGFIKK